MQKVAVLAFDGISPFHLSVPTLVFGAAGIASAPPHFEVTVFAEQPGRLSTPAGYAISVDHGLNATEGADMVVVPSWRHDTEPSRELLGALIAAHAAGARIVGLCLGATVIAASGLADGREVATHWSAARGLGERYPEVTVRSDILWSDLGDVITSAGVAAALDCCLHIVRTSCGTAAATELARALVLAPHRTGSQAQYIPIPLSNDIGDDPIERAMVWARTNLGEPIDLDTWAATAHMARRTFTRQFRDRTASSPQQWLLRQRIDRARLLLETSDEPIDLVAERSGFGSAVTLRHHFNRVLDISPAAHRAAFRSVAV
ncbi:GlxA family transcriptional regulator [Antrihabitans stalactiti]|uniref:Helix-turn-helix domain-containing protein n=1 Tax=Antrihabitans stalactiti TaxID=2584121 RepID=A0A848KC46_9NOCA|nr:helix-turn-helix domain-containing protein [Antrihabitans stalactiti]NMN94754.1 helix-turn-helix domain-containing protein [Antrihabitans stalactiti]